MIQIKGATLKARLDFARERGGEALMEKLKTLPDPVGDLARQRVFSLRDFPLQAMEALCAAIVRELRGGDEMHREMGAFSADEHRALQKIVHGKKTDPHALLQGLCRQFPQYLVGDIGAAVYEKTERGGRIIWSGHGETGRNHCLSSIGYSTRLLENHGVTGATGRDAECLLRKDKRCVWEFSWQTATGAVRSTGAIKAEALQQAIKRKSN
jgi:hypothetical protein